MDQNLGKDVSLFFHTIFPGILLYLCTNKLSQTQDLRQLEQELHTEIYPGTEIMIDVGTHRFVKSQGQSVLVPQPSDDEHDPLVSTQPI